MAPSCQIELGRDDLHFTFKDVAGEFLSDASTPPEAGLRIPRHGAGTRCELLLTRDRRRSRSRPRLRSRPWKDLRCRPGCLTCSSTRMTGWEATPRSGRHAESQAGRISRNLEGRFSRREVLDLELADRSALSLVTG